MSTPILIKTVQTDIQYQEVRRLIEEYAASRNFDAALAKIFVELDQLAEYYPLMLIAYWKNQAAGCVAIQVLEEGICEMKRMYVSPDFRGQGIGQELIKSIVEAAKNRNFRRIRLDTHPQMLAAQKLYQNFGFKEIERYNQNPIPGIRFFELQLFKGV
jgi:GNAT superfamily N-acetyltransferase